MPFESIRDAFHERTTPISQQKLLQNIYWEY